MHDIISSFTAISAGIDLGAESDLWPIVLDAKTQVHHQLCLLRFLFSPTQGTPEEATALIINYAKSLKITIQGHITQDSRLATATCLWALKQARGCINPYLVLENDGITLNAQTLSVQTSDLQILQNMKEPLLIQESYAGYIAKIAQIQHKNLDVSLADHRMTLQWINQKQE